MCAGERDQLPGIDAGGDRDCVTFRNPTQDSVDRGLRTVVSTEDYEFPESGDWVTRLKTACEWNRR